MPMTDALRREFGATFAALATENPYISVKGREECRNALELVEGVVRGVVATDIDCDELIQECLIRLPDAIRQYRGNNGSSLRTYLKKVIQNDVIDAIKRERKDLVHNAQPLPMESQPQGSLGHSLQWVLYDNLRLDDDLASSISADYARQQLRGWLDWVTPDQAIVLALCTIHGLTQEAAATRLGTTRGGVLSRLNKGLANIRKHLDKINSAQPVSILESGSPK